MPTADHSLNPILQVRVVEDLVFSHATNAAGACEALHLDLYLPAPDPHPLRPAVLWFHGGGFRPGNDKRQIYVPMFARAFAERGFVGIAPDYRVREDAWHDLKGTIRDAVADGRSALQWVRDNARTYGVDPQRIALAGGSAGGMLVLNLIHDTERALLGDRDGARALLDLWGTPAGPARLFARVAPGSPPTLIVHGTADELVPFENSERFAAELRDAGVPVKLLSLAGAPHTPIRDHWDEIVKAAAQFLCQTVGS